MSHTPGPWDLSFSGKFVMASFTAGGHSIARMDDHEVPQQTQQANARLIAAAPDLLAALKIAEDVLARFPFSSEIWPNGMHPNTGVEQIRAAITKAEGDAP